MTEKSTISEIEFSQLRLQPDALLATAKRHESTLERVNVLPLKELPGIKEQYLYWFKHLFLLTFFYDYCLDRPDEEQYPEALFICSNMYEEYCRFIRTEYGDKGLSILQRNNAHQVYYQMIEKQWLHPSEYSQRFPNYNDYYKKQVLCLTHLEFLFEDKATMNNAAKVIELYKQYWSLILLIDDMMDVESDINSQTLTPMICCFAKANTRMPTVEDADQLRAYGQSEYDRLFNQFEKAMFDVGLFAFLDIVCEMRGKL